MFALQLLNSPSLVKLWLRSLCRPKWLFCLGYLSTFDFVRSNCLTKSVVFFFNAINDCWCLGMLFTENSACNGGCSGATWWCTGWIWFACCSLCCSTLKSGSSYVHSSVSSSIFFNWQMILLMQIIIDSFLVNFWLRKDLSTDSTKVSWVLEMWLMCTKVSWVSEGPLDLSTVQCSACFLFVMVASK